MQKRRNLALLLILLMTLLCAVPVMAEGYDIQYVGTGEEGQIADGYRTVLFRLASPDSGESLAYCVDQETYIQLNSRYMRTALGESSYYDEADAKQIRAIVLNSYPFITLETLHSATGMASLTSSQAITASQCAIWHYANGNSYGGGDSGVKALYDWYLALPPMDTQAQPVAAVELSSSAQAETDGSVTAQFRYRTTGLNADGSPILLTHAFDRDVEDIYGASVVSAPDGEGYTRVTVSGLPGNAAFLFSVSGEQVIARDAYFYEPQGGRCASQSLVGAFSGETALYQETPFSYVPSEGYSLTIHKVDGLTLLGLQGAEFEISNTQDFSGTVIRQATDAEGYITWNGLTEGVWYVREVKAPEGYIPYEGVFPVQVYAYTREQTYKNTAYGGIEIIKVDDTGASVAGAVFSIYAGETTDESALVAEGLVTGETGVIVKGSLEPGVYTVLETAVPTGWHLNDTPQTVTVESGKQTQVTMTNCLVKRGKLLLYKRDAVTGEQLAGAVIGVYRDEGHTDLIMELTTSVSQAVTVDALLPGTYYIKENDVPDGYLLDSTPQTVILNEGESKAVVFYNNEIPQTAGNYGFMLLIGGGLMAVTGAMLLIFRKRLFAGSKT